MKHELPPDEDILEKIQSTLDHANDVLDPEITARLAKARQQAITAIPQRVPPAVWTRRWALAASVLVVASGVYVWMSNNSNVMPVGDEMVLLSAGEDLELIEDLDFYRWLESEGRAS